MVTNLHFDRFRLGIFAASAVVPMDEGISHHQEGNNIYGMYGAIDNLIVPHVEFRAVRPLARGSQRRGRNRRPRPRPAMKASKPMAFAGRDWRSTISITPSKAFAKAARTATTTFTPGAPPTALATASRSMYWKPRVFTQYDYASGDKNAHDGIHGTFDTMYPTAHDRFGISDQFGWQNINAVRAGITIEPHRRWTVTGQWLDFWLASATDSLYNTSGGSIVRNTTGIGRDHIGTGSRRLYLV